MPVIWEIFSLSALACFSNAFVAFICAYSLRTPALCLVSDATISASNVWCCLMRLRGTGSSRVTGGITGSLPLDLSGLEFVTGCCSNCFRVGVLSFVYCNPSL